MFRLLPFVILLFGLLTSRAAQTTSAPTDNQMYASYCLGVIDATKQEVEKTIASTPQTDASIQSLRYQEAENDQRRRRFAAYLLATGILTSNDTTDMAVGLAAAMNQGSADTHQCLAQFLQKCFKPDADDTEHPKAAEELQTYFAVKITQCRQNIPTCSKVERCSKNDALPF